MKTHVEIWIGKNRLKFGQKTPPDAQSVKKKTVDTNDGFQFASQTNILKRVPGNNNDVHSEKN